MTSSKIPQLPLLSTLAVLGLAATACEDYDRVARKPLIDAEKFPELAAGETVRMAGEVGQTHRRSFEFDPEADYEDLDDVLVLVDPGGVPSEGARVTLEGRLIDRAGQPHGELYDIDHVPTEDRETSAPTLRASKLQVWER